VEAVAADGVALDEDEVVEDAEIVEVEGGGVKVTPSPESNQMKYLWYLFVSMR